MILLHSQLQVANTYDESAGTITLTITSDAGFESDINIDYIATTISATSDDYYTSGPGLVALSTPERSVTIQYTIIDDTLIETTETFDVSLASFNLLSSRVTLASGSTISITDNDQVLIRVTPFTSIDEGTSETTPTDFNIQLTFEGTSVISDQIISIDVTISQGSTNPVMIADISTSETTLPYTITGVQFAVGVKTIAYTVSINADKVVERDETFVVTISNPLWNGVINPGVLTDSAQDSQIITILNDDSTTISFPSTIPSPNEDDGVFNMFTLEMTNPADQLITVSVTLIGVSAQAGSDFDSTDFTPSKPVTFTVGSTTSEMFSITLIDDNIQESEESLIMSLSNPLYDGAAKTGVTATTSPGIVTIIDDDAINTLTITYAGFSEGSTVGNETDVIVTVQLDNLADKIINIQIISNLCYPPCYTCT